MSDHFGFRFTGGVTALREEMVAGHEVLRKEIREEFRGLRVLVENLGKQEVIYMVSRPLTSYIAAAMRHAHYEILEDGTFFGEIPGCEGLWGSGESLEECRDNLQGALEDWVMLGLRFGNPLPVIDGIDLLLAVSGRPGC